MHISPTQMQSMYFLMYVALQEVFDYTTVIEPEITALSHCGY